MAIFFFLDMIGQRVEKMSEMEHLKQSEASLPLLHTDLKHPTNWKHPEKYLQVTDDITTKQERKVSAGLNLNTFELHTNLL